jgi:SpoVK/Ycf46/Vps4 family AAA+-type ATPase
MAETKKNIRKPLVSQELVDYIRSGASLIYINTNDERFTMQDIRRCVSSLNLNKDKAEARTYGYYEWSCTKGTLHASMKALEHEEDHYVNVINRKMETEGLVVPEKTDDDSTKDALAALNFFSANVPTNKKHDADCHVVVLKDIHPHLKDIRVVRKVKDIVVHNDDEESVVRRCLIIVSPVMQIPIELRNLVTVIDWNLPTREEIMDYLSQHSILSTVEKNPSATSAAGAPWRTEYTHEEVSKILTSLTGLSLPEIDNVVTVSQVKFKEIRADFLLESKKQMILKNGLLEYYESDVKLEDVGGMDELKSWLRLRQSVFTEEARKFGIDTPKGLMLVGPPGCGKSYTAKATANLLNMPLVRFDVGKVFSQTVGSSEANVREVIKLIEAVSPCVVMIDEIEKGLAGVQSSNASDAGTTARVVGTLLTWLNDKTAPVFVVATANNIRQIPPELSRKGRFDEIFFVSLPEASERKETFSIHLHKKGYEPEDFDVEGFAKATDKWSNSECEEAIKAALIFAWNENKSKLKNSHIFRAIAEGIPLSKTAEEDIEYLYDWVGWDKDKKDGIRARYSSKARKEVTAQKGDNKLVFVDAKDTKKD